MRTIYTLSILLFFCFSLSLNAQQEDKFKPFSPNIELGIHHPIFVQPYIYSDLNRPRSNVFFDEPLGFGYDININAPIQSWQRFYFSSSIGLLNLSTKNYQSRPRGVTNIRTIDSWNPYLKLNLGLKIIEHNRYRLSIEGFGGVGLLRYPTIQIRTFFFEGPNLLATTYLDMNFTPIISFATGGKLTNLFKLNKKLHLGFIIKYSAWMVGQNIIINKERGGETIVRISEDFDTIQIPSASFSVSYLLHKK